MNSKKLVRTVSMVSLVFVLVFMGTFGCFASESESEFDNDGGISYWFGNVEVLFDSASTLSAEQREAIAGVLAGVSEDGPANGGATTYGLTCTLFGHKLESEIIVTIEHQVNEEDPRCERFVHEVFHCTRCDYVKTNFVSSIYISCCD